MSNSFVYQLSFFWGAEFDTQQAASVSDVFILKYTFTEKKTSTSFSFYFLLHPNAFLTRGV